MRRRVSLWCAAALSLVAGAGTADTLVLKDFVLIDGSGAPARPVAALTARDGLIAAIDDRAPGVSPPPMQRVTTIDLDGAWVIPGLIDTHVHVARLPDTRRRAADILAGALSGGVTAVRDLGGDARALAEIVRASESGELAAPTLVYAAIFGGPSLFEDPRVATLANGFTPGTAPWTRRIDDATELSLAIAEARGAGVTGIKLYAGLNAALAARIAAEARRQNLPSWAHATVFPAGPGDLVEAGVRVLSHAPYLVWEAAESIPDDYAERTRGPWRDIPADHPKIKALFETMVARGVLLDATLFIYDQMGNYSPEVEADWTGEALAWGAEATALAHRMGVRITVGTDWFEPSRPWGLPNTHQELELLVKLSGLSPLDAIVAGTRNGAAALGLERERGTIEIGKAADFLVLSADPLVDIRNTAKIALVIKNGRLVEG